MNGNRLTARRKGGQRDTKHLCLDPLDGGYHRVRRPCASFSVARRSPCPSCCPGLHNGSRSTGQPTTQACNQPPRQMLRLAVTLALLLCATPSVLPAQHASMNFFLTSSGRGKGADLGGLRGADAHCGQLAYAAGLGSDLTWRAYLSTQAT